MVQIPTSQPSPPDRVPPLGGAHHSQPAHQHQSSFAHGATTPTAALRYHRTGSKAQHVPPAATHAAKGSLPHQYPPPQDRRYPTNAFRTLASPSSIREAWKSHYKPKEHRSDGITRTVNHIQGLFGPSGSKGYGESAEGGGGGFSGGRGGGGLGSASGSQYPSSKPSKTSKKFVHFSDNGETTHKASRAGGSSGGSPRRPKAFDHLDLRKSDYHHRTELRHQQHHRQPPSPHHHHHQQHHHPHLDITRSASYASANGAITPQPIIITTFRKNGSSARLSPDAFTSSPEESGSTTSSMFGSQGERSPSRPSVVPRFSSPMSCDIFVSQLRETINTDVMSLLCDIWGAIQNLAVSVTMVSEECKTLKHSLNQVETDWSSAKVQVGSLHGKVGNLESVLRFEDVYGLADGPRPRGGSSLETVLIQMKEAADKRRDLERQHAEALAQLREQQAAIADCSKTNQKDRKASVEVTEALQSKIRELEKKAEVQNLRHEELLLEMQSLKKAQGSPKNSWSRSGSLSAELQSPDSGDVTPDSSQILSNGSTARSTPVPAPGFGMSLPHGLDGIGLVDLPDYLLAHQPPMSTSPLAGQSGQRCCEERAHWPPSFSSLSPSRRIHKSLTSLNSLSSGIYTNTTSSSFLPTGSIGITTGSSPLPSSATCENASSEIDRIMAKIEQDNRILAELDKSRSTIGLSSTTTGASSFKSSDMINSFGMTSRNRTGITPSTFVMSSTGMGSYTGHAVTNTVPSMDLSNPIMNPLGNTYGGNNPLGANPLGLMDPSLTDPTSLNLATGATHGVGLPSMNSLTGTSILGGSNMSGVTLQSTNPLAFSQSATLAGMGVAGTGAGLIGGGISNPVFTNVTPLPTIITTSYDKDGNLKYTRTSNVDKYKNLVNGNIPGLMMPPFETDNRILDVLEIPGKGRCHVYIARYSYDPFQHSPNENPEAELAVNAGDYVLVWGAMDEDGFFDGELLDGRRGLVPSNFVEKLVGEDLIEFHQSVVMGLRDCDESMSTSVPQDLDFISQDDSQMMIDLAVNQTRHNTYSSYIDLEDIIEEEEETLGEHDLFFSVLVPPPVQLTLERQLNKSIVIGWNPPLEAQPGSIESYHVYVNGLLKTTVRATERTRALVEGVDSTKLHRISVRSVTPNRRTSRDAACTMVIGKDSPLGPTSVKATSITSTSAVISWLPSNSNFQHTVCVNNVEVRTVKPGVYRHTITGLSPNTTYRVTIRAKNLRAPQFDEKASKNQDRLSTTIEFRTLPKGWRDPKGLPDPPVDVQVEPGPQDGSLLVTWLPVTINSTGGTSNGAPVTGYAVYADGKKVTEVESPTGDHALIDLTKIPGFEPKQVTVRTKSRDSVSADSVPSQIPNHFTRGRGRGKDMHADGHKPGPHHGLPGPHGPHGPQGVHHGSTAAGLRDRLLGRRGAPAPGVMTDHLGQTILDHEDNLSDKEIYPGQQQGQQGPNAPIPAIGPARSGLARLSNSLFSTLGQLKGKGGNRARQITKDSASEGHGSQEVFSEEDYEHGQGRHGRFDPRATAPRSHLERGRPPPPPHHNRPVPRDIRDPREVRDPRDPHYRDGRDPRDLPRDRRDPHMREPHNPRDPREQPREQPRDTRDSRYDAEGRHRGEYGRDYPGGREGRSRGSTGGVGGPVDQHTRIFVALFDYDPSTMSPNPEACDEELPFREGQLIKVMGDKDPDGFYWGEAGGRPGYVPCNMVSEVQVDDDRVAQELLKESDTGRRRRDGSVGRRAHQGDRWGDIYANMPVRKMIAMYDYDPQELSPNVDSEVELSFQTGDIIYVYGDMDDDGFYMGELRGQRGLVPSNFLQDAPQDYSDDHRQSDMMTVDNDIDGRIRATRSELESRRDTLDPRDRGPPPGPSGRGTGPGAHGPPPPPRPDQRDRRKDPRSVASRSVTSAQDMRGGQGDPHLDHANTTSAAERGGRSVSRDRLASTANTKANVTTAAGTVHTNTTAATTSTTASTAAAKGKINGLDLLDEEVDNGPAISSADLDQLMEDCDLNDPALQAEEAAKAAEAAKVAEAAKEAEKAAEEKPAGLAGALPGGLGAGLSSIPNPMGEGNIMGKLGDLAAQNPVTDVMSKGKDFFFKKFGL